MWRLFRSFKKTLLARLVGLYGEENVNRLLERFALVCGRYSFLEKQCSVDAPCWDERSCIVITYGDMVTRADAPPLATLHRFLVDYLGEVVTGVHLLPFFPYSSDDGFSVIDYRQVDPALGRWDDVRRIGDDFRLMVDLVLNHVSSRSGWFHDYIGAIAPARDYFIDVEGGLDLSRVVRPRTSPLLTPVHTVKGERQVWTTFSADQVDLNYKNPDVLLEIVDIMLGYIKNNAGIIRLDAIAYLWKEIGTQCINLPETHQVVKLLRDIIENVTPGTLLLTETNLPHEENISYFGKGDEAHLVYQFSLPPLLLHTLQSGSSAHLRQWVSDLAPPPPGCNFVNFAASHDGIGVRPLEGLLSAEEIARLADVVRTCGGYVSSRSTPDGGEQPYELNITYFDAMADPLRPDDIARQLQRFLCSQTIMLSLQGIPAIYFHSFTGTRNNVRGVEATGIYRAVNRGRWRDEELRSLLDNPETITGQVFRGYTSLLTKRADQPAFHPDAEQQLVATADYLFVIERLPGKGPPVTCIHNVTGENHQVALEDLGTRRAKRTGAWDIINDEEIGSTLSLGPYQCRWLI